MGDLTQASIDKLNTTLEQLASNSQGSPTTPRSSGQAGQPSGAGEETVSVFTRINQGLGNAGILGTLGQLLTQYTLITNKTGDIAGQFSSIASMTGIGALNIPGAALQNTRDQAASASKGGLTPDINYETSARTAGFKTIDDFIGVVQKNQVSLQGAGRYADDTAGQLLKLSKATQESEMGQQQQREKFLSKEDQAVNAVISRMNSREALNTGTQEEQAKKYGKAADASLELGDAIARQTNVAGMSVKQVQAELAARLQLPDVMAKMRVATEDQRQAIIQQQVSMIGVGSAAQELTSKFTTGGRITEQNTYQMIAMGSKATQQLAQGTKLLQSSSAEDRARGQELVNQSKSSAAVWQQSAAFQRMQAANQGTALGAVLDKTLSENRTAGNLAYEQRNRTPGQTAAQATREGEVGRQNIGRGREPSSGEVAPGVQRGREIGGLQIEIENQKIAQANALTNAMLTTSTRNIEGLTDVIKKGFGDGGTVSQATANLTGILARVSSATSGLLNVGGPGAPPRMATPTNAPGQGQGGRGAPPSTATPVTPKAKGGPVNAGELYLVGEDGPEMFRSKTAGDIIPNDQTSKLGTGGSSDMFSKIKDQLGSSQDANMPNPSEIFGKMKDQLGGMPDMLAQMKNQMGVFPSILEKANAHVSSVSEATKEIKTPAPLPVPESEPRKPDAAAEVKSDNITLNDLHADLLELNKNIMKMTEHTADISDASNKSARIAAKSSGNRAVI